MLYHKLSERIIKNSMQAVTEHLFFPKQLQSIYFAKGAQIEIWYWIEKKCSVAVCDKINYL